MRFILNEQFILEETKYMLEERYSLTEATDIDGMKLAKDLTALRDWFSKKTPEAIDSYVAKCVADEALRPDFKKKLIELTEREGLLDQVIGRLTASSDSLKDKAGKFLHNTAANVASKFGKEMSGYESEKTFAQQILASAKPELKDQLSKLHNALQNVGKNYDQIKIEQWDTFYAILKNAAEELAGINPAEQEVVEVDKLSGQDWQQYFKKAAANELFKVKVKTNSGTDIIEIKSILDIRKVYLANEWGGQAEKALNQLGDGFWIELKDLGFTATTNPFIKFLQLTQGMKDTEPKFPITIGAEQFGALHNAYIKKYISKEDLVLNGSNDIKPTTDNFFILFNDSLYSMKGPEIYGILKILAEVKSKAFEKFEKPYSDNLGNLKIALTCQGCTTNMSAVEFSQIRDNLDTYEIDLKSFDDVNYMYKELTGETVTLDTKEQINLDILDKLRATVTDNETAGREAIAYIVQQFYYLLGEDAVDQYIAKYKLKITNSIENMKKYNKLIDLNKFTTDKSSIQALIKAIAVASKLEPKSDEGAGGV